MEHDNQGCSHDVIHWRRHSSFDRLEGNSDTQHVCGSKHRQRGPTTSDYGSDSTDRLQLEA
jgi:hypothetical protein